MASNNSGACGHPSIRRLAELDLRGADGLEGAGREVIWAAPGAAGGRLRAGRRRPWRWRHHAQVQRAQRPRGPALRLALKTQINVTSAAASFIECPTANAMPVACWKPCCFQRSSPALAACILKVSFQSVCMRLSLYKLCNHVQVCTSPPWRRAPPATCAARPRPRPRPPWAAAPGGALRARPPARRPSRAPAPAHRLWPSDRAMLREQPPARHLLRHQLLHTAC